MNAFAILALLLTLAALFAYINHRFIGLPSTIGLTLLSLLLSVALVAANWLGLPLQAFAKGVLERVDLSRTLLDGALSFLLFAGALHVDWKVLHQERWSVALLATGGVLLSTLLVAGMSHFLFGWLGFKVPFLICLLFGALISPTDPIAVLGLLKQANAPASLATKIAGESLFNDGIGVVVFLLFYELQFSGDSELDLTHVGTLLLREAGGGIALGLALGWATYRLLKSVDAYQVEVLLTLALVSGGYELAKVLHTSGPLAIVVAGIVIGNAGRKFAMSDRTRQNLDTFWELIDEILNALLFVVLGLEVLVLKYQPGFVTLGLLTIPLVLLARVISVTAPGPVLKLFRQGFSWRNVVLLTWGGLRGAISIALALTLPSGPERDLLLAATYAVVAFSILVQGLTMPWLLGRVLPARNGEGDHENGG